MFYPFPQSEAAVSRQGITEIEITSSTSLMPLLSTHWESSMASDSSRSTVRCGGFSSGPERGEQKTKWEKPQEIAQHG
jgi:hypothetical protein